MNVIKQSSDQIIIENKPSKKETTIYNALFFICIALTAIVAVGVYHLPVPLSIAISIIITAGFFLRHRHTYTYIIDKSKFYIFALKDNKKIHELDYSFGQIKSIKTTIDYKDYLNPYGGTFLVSLIVVLENNEEKIIGTSSTTAILPFFIDVVANKQAKVGKEIAEFLDVPFIEGEYHPPVI